MSYTIDDFWVPLLGGGVRPENISMPSGWAKVGSVIADFVEAPLLPSTGFDDVSDPAGKEIIFVSAPGAVGKTTLARQIAAKTGSIYINLADAAPVGGNSLSGGLAKSGLFSDWTQDQTTVLIDGLDEARIRVTQEAFEAFLDDISTLCAGRKKPIVLFGRTGSVQDAWLHVEGKVRTSVLEVGYYAEESAVEFTYAKLRSKRPKGPHDAIERDAIKLLLEKLRGETDGNGGNFAGYAPVLETVAERVADEDNASAIISAVTQGEKSITLQTVVDAILERERKKLSSIAFEDEQLVGVLYRNPEQLDHLISVVFGESRPAVPQMNARDAQRYDTALKTWVPEHPFLDGNGRPSTPVFEAVILVAALRNKNTEAKAVASQIARGAAANPFLAEFYSDGSSGGETYVPGEHIGILYSSLRARLAIGETAALLIDAPYAEDDEAALALEAVVEIAVTDKNAERTTTVSFISDQTGVVRLGSHVEDVEIYAPLGSVEIGPSSEATLVAPISLECAQLQINANKVIAEPQIHSSENSITLIADNYKGDINSVPNVRGNVQLAVGWPEAKKHPWTNFAFEPLPAHNERIDEGLRRFRKFVIAFRSHSKGNLARYQAKIDHERMTKGSGQAVLDLLKERGVIYPVKSMYYLDPDKLGAVTGATYAECVTRQFKQATLDFIDEALNRA